MKVKQNCDSSANSRSFLGATLAHNLVSWVLTLKNFSLEMSKNDVRIKDASKQSAVFFETFQKKHAHALYL